MNKKSGPKMSFTEDTVEIQKTEVKTPVKSKGTKKRDWSFYAIIICVICLSIPAAILGTSLISASLSSRKPLFGDRFEGQYDHVISSKDQGAIVAAVSEVEGVSSAKAELISGTLRVYINAGDTAKDSYPIIGDNAYVKVLELLPVDQYFTKDDNFHRYDLEVHVFNMTKTTEETKPNFIYYTMIKTSMHDEPISQFVSDPISQEFVDKLWAIQAEREKPEEEVPTEPETFEGEEDATE